MNRPLWTQTLSKDSSPAWPCSECRKGTFALVPGSLTHKQTAWSKSFQPIAGGIEDITFIFTAWVKCNNPACGDEAAIVGTGGVETYHDNEEGTEECSTAFTPRFCTAMPDMFELPEKCPAGIAHELHGAFGLFWSDPSATANRVRIALERLMDHLKIQRHRKNKKGKFDKLTLHHRIEILTKTEPKIGDQLMALKLLGNTGSHDGGVLQNDVLDAFEIIEHALLELIDQRSKRVAALAQGIKERHSPGSEKRRPPF